MIENCCKCWIAEESSLYGGIAKQGALYFAKLPENGGSDNITAKNSLDMGFLDAILGIADEFGAPKNVDSFINSVDVCFVPGPNSTMAYAARKKEVDELLNQIFRHKGVTKIIEAKSVKTRTYKGAPVYILE